jgi:hypothetical protein
MNIYILWVTNQYITKYIQNLKYPYYKIYYRVSLSCFENLLYKNIKNFFPKSISDFHFWTFIFVHF